MIKSKMSDNYIIKRTNCVKSEIDILIHLNLLT